MEEEQGSKELESAKYEMFSHEFIVDLNGKQAAIRTGYSAKTAEVQASRMLSNVKVQDRIAYLKAKRVERTEVNADDIVKQLEILRKANISEYVELITVKVPRGKDKKGNEVLVDIQEVRFKDFSELTQDQLSCIESIKQGKQGIELKLHGKEWTIEKLNRHIGFYEQDNTQKNLTDLARQAAARLFPTPEQWDEHDKTP